MANGEWRMGAANGAIRYSLFARYFPAAFLSAALMRSCQPGPSC